MTRLRALLARVRDRLRGRELDRELREQIAAHLDEATDDLVRNGLPPEEARKEALRHFGGVTRVEDAWREAHAVLAPEHIWHDVRQAWRSVRRSAGDAVAVIAVLAIGIAAVTAGFALLNAVVLRPLPYPDADRLVAINHAAPGLGIASSGLSDALFHTYITRSRTLESLALYRGSRSMNLREPDAGAERVEVTYASAAVFQVLRARPLIGRLFTPDDGRPGFMDLRWQIPILLSHAFWTDRFGADPRVIGRVLTINESPREVVGVLPAGFGFPGPDTQIWMLIEPRPNVVQGAARSLTWNAVARLTPGASAKTAQDDLTRLVAAMTDTDEEARRAGLQPIVTPLKTVVIGGVSTMIWLLFAAVGLMLAVAVANAAGLMLVRADARVHEVQLRRALGAGRLQVARMFVIEACLLAALAGSVAVPLSRAMLVGALRLAPAGLPRAGEVAVDRSAVLFAVAIAALIAVGCGLWSMRRPGTASAVLRSTPNSTPRRSRAAQVLMTAQVALALTLMTGAALMFQTSRNLSTVDLGFSPERVLAVDIGLPSRRAAQHVEIYRHIVDRIRHLPEVESASAASFVPLTPPADLYPVQRGDPPVPFKFFLPGYFETMRIAVPEGDRMDLGAVPILPHPVLVSAPLARRVAPPRSAVGTTIRRLERNGDPVEMADGPVPPFTIAGVVSEVRERSPREPPSDVVYVPLMEPRVELSLVPTTMTLVIRSPAAPAALAATVRRAVTEIAPYVSIGDTRTLDEIVQSSRGRELFVGVLLAGAALVALFLGAIGVYGTVAHLVRGRTRELAVRTALGAGPGTVLREMMRGALASAAMGAAVGVGFAVIAGRSLSALLFGVDAHDPMVLLGVTAALAAAIVAAALVGARGAVSKDLVAALRE